jgi:rsbT co-antagonist protein RsbR
MTTNQNELQQEIARLRQQVAELEQERQQKMEESRLFYAMAENAPDGIGVSGADGLMFYANAALRQMTRYGDELVGKDITALTAPEDLDRLDVAFRTVRDRGAWQGELPYLRADGTTFPGMVSSFTVVDEQGNVQAVAAIIRDISDRKQMEQQLQEQEERLRFILEGSGDGAWDTNLVTGEVYYSPQYARMLGYEPEEIPSSFAVWHALIHPEDVAKVDQLLQERLRQQSSEYEYEYRMQHKSGEWRWLLVRGNVTVRDEDGTPLRMSGTAKDITERKQMEMDLRIFKTFADKVPDAVAISDESTDLLYTNAAYQEMLGYSEEELSRMNFVDHFAPEDTDKVQEAVDQTIINKSWQDILPFQRKDGTKLLVSSSGFLVYNEKGDLSNFIGIFRDITQQLKEEEERQALQQQVIDAQRTAIRELSTPLIPLSSTVVLMPLVGSIDSQRAQMVMEVLLEGIAHYQSDTAIVDITGVKVIDTQVANALIQAAQAAKLLGSQTILTGIGPAMAQTLVHLGADLSTLITRGSLQAGIAEAMKREGGIIIG